ncbi:ATPase, T2SS/T4P/T4SS family, partial [Oceanospirillum sp. HFRX-1_2]
MAVLNSSLKAAEIDMQSDFSGAPKVADKLAEISGQQDLQTDSLLSEKDLLGQDTFIQSLPFVRDPQVRTFVPFTFAKKQGVLVGAEGDQAICYAREPLNASAVGEAMRLCGPLDRLVMLSAAEFEQQLTRQYQSDSSETLQMVQGIGDQMDLASLADSVSETEDLLDQQDDAPIIRLINGLLQEAIREGVSDIHIETFEKRLVVRFRVDGVLRPVVEPKRALAPLLTSRIKVMAKLDIAEKRVPQDGRISLRLGGR